MIERNFMQKLILCASGLMPIRKLRFLILLAVAWFVTYQGHAQLALQNISCTGCTTTGSTGYTTAALASAGAGAATTTYNLSPGAFTKQCATVVSDVNGTVGIINSIQVQSPTGNTVCQTNTAGSRKGSLYLASGGNCTGSELQAVRKGANSSTFNHEYIGLTPNTSYIFVFETTVDGSCTNYVSSSIRYYGGVLPAFTFNCGTASTTGTFLANGIGGQTGTFVVPITGATAGTATFNVSGTGFTGILATTLTAGQTSVTIPITYDGTGVAGSRTLTVTSSGGSGTCSKAVTVAIPPTSFTYPFNCTGSTVNGIFIANAIAGQTGSVTLPIGLIQSGSATFTVTGTNFSGTLTTTLISGQSSVTIPITYTGAGTEGSRLLTITSASGTGTCTVSVPIQSACKASGGRIGQ